MARSKQTKFLKTDPSKSGYSDSKFCLSFWKWRIQMLQQCFKYCKQEGMGAYSPLALEEGLGSLLGPLSSGGNLF